MRAPVWVPVLIVVSGCPSMEGPCSSPSILFPDVRARGSVTDAGVMVDVSWSATSAPGAFYAMPTVVSRASVLLTDAGVTGAQVSTPSFPADGGPLEFSLRYGEGPTRTCRHAGMDDTYVLSVAVPQSADGGVGPGTVTTSVDLGAL